MAQYDRFRRRLGERLARGGRRPHVLSLAEWQRYRDEHQQTLSGREMRQVVARSADALRGLYVHMDLKRARRGVEPLTQLQVLGDRIDTHEHPDTRTFHVRMLEIFKMLGDVHTAYRLPVPYSGAIAFLPFLIGSYFDENGGRRFLITHTLWQPGELGSEPFARGVELVSWNGTLMDQAVRRGADFEEGSNTPHDTALALQFMTLRWLGASIEPESPWVVVEYRTPSRRRTRHAELYWSVFVETGAPRLIVTEQARAVVFGQSRRFHDERSVHVASEVVHFSRKRLFVPSPRDVQDVRERRLAVAARLRDRFAGHVSRRDLRAFTADQRQVLTQSSAADEVPSLLPLFFTARIHSGRDLLRRMRSDRANATLTSRDRTLIAGKRFGYLGIRSFAHEEPDRGLFKYELCRLLNLLPADGLVIDIRDNPGGSARNAEESLQFLTPKPITPLPFRFLASAVTRRVAGRGTVFDGYQRSIETALGTGAAFSAGRPITSPVHANSGGQQYFGPVVLVTSATTYSAGDVFAAGFEDNGIGPIIGVDETTGAGGANCWFYNEEIAPMAHLQALPAGINMQLAVRQCLRVGDHNAGVPIEEIGIRIDKIRQYRLTRKDVIEPRPWGLLLRAVKELTRLCPDPVDLQSELDAVDGALIVTVRTEGIERLDSYMNGRPATHRIDSGRVSFPAPADGRVGLELRGFAGTGQKLVARHVQVFDVSDEIERARDRRIAAARGQRER